MEFHRNKNGTFQKGKPSWNKGSTGVMKAWNKGKNAVTFTCRCGNIFTAPAWRKQKFCSKSCVHKGNKTNLGKKHSIETRKKMSLAHPKGELSPYWIKDRTQLKRFNDTAKDRRSYAYIDWRKSVWVRDSYKCRIGNKDCNGRIEVHHILSYTEYPELRYEITNGITLCHAHHPRKRAEEKRLEPYFKELVSVSKD